MPVLFLLFALGSGGFNKNRGRRFLSRVLGGGNPGCSSVVWGLCTDSATAFAWDWKFHVAPRLPRCPGVHMSQFTRPGVHKSDLFCFVLFCFSVSCYCAGAPVKRKNLERGLNEFTSDRFAYSLCAPIHGVSFLVLLLLLLLYT